MLNCRSFLISFLFCFKISFFHRAVLISNFAFCQSFFYHNSARFPISVQSMSFIVEHKLFPSALLYQGSPGLVLIKTIWVSYDPQKVSRPRDGYI